MSTTAGNASSPPSDASVVPALFRQLIDDAAVFPPGLAPLDRAVAEHVARRRYAAVVGPLVLPGTAAATVPDLLERQPPSTPLRVLLVARPGSSADPVRDGATLLHAAPGVDVVGLEVGWSPSWRDLADLGVPISVEIPRAGFDQALDDLAAAVERDEADRTPVQAKFRTGATDTWPWPDEDELARFVHGCATRHLAFKLTGGLHHAVRVDLPAATTSPPSPATEPHHGVLNVLSGVRAALDGATTAEVAQILADRDGPGLARAVSALPEPDIASMRGAFTAYGCCTVTEPIAELVELGLLEEE